MTAKQLDVNNIVCLTYKQFTFYCWLRVPGTKVTRKKISYARIFLLLHVVSQKLDAIVAHWQLVVSCGKTNVLLNDKRHIDTDSLAEFSLISYVSAESQQFSF